MFPGFSSRIGGCIDRDLFGLCKSLIPLYESKSLVFYGLVVLLPSFFSQAAAQDPSLLDRDSALAVLELSKDDFFLSFCFVRC